MDETGDCVEVSSKKPNTHFYLHEESQSKMIIITG
jgi:hypothetical protein